jgi:cyclic dehypoxanthinyl futalosine synthase
MLNSKRLLELGARADSVRRELHPEGTVTFVVDRNINYTNVCINKCGFCAFWRDADHPEAYLIDKDDLFTKIQETVNLGGTQILLQGGLHPDLRIDYYIDLLTAIKRRFDITVHGFSPPEIRYIADSAQSTVRETLKILKEAGLDSIPGGGAEILSDRVRRITSPKKLSSSEWLDVMKQAHNLGMRTTATMMFGAVEDPDDIVQHLDSIRALQDKTGGFTAFIPWSFQPGNTALARNARVARHKLKNTVTAVEYLKILSVSRLYLDNVRNIQASWVTQGLKLAQVALRFGANDFGSTMIEENVVAAAGVAYRVSKEDMILAIKNAKFSPAQRDTYYNIIARY